MKTLLRSYLLCLILLFCSFPLKAQGPLKALRFDGVNDYVLSSTDNRGIVDQVTVFAWVKTTSTKYHWIAGKYDWAGDRGYHLYIKDGKAAFGGRDGSTIYRTSGLSTYKVNDGNWHNIVGVCNKGTWSIYIDGILQSQLKTGYSSTNLASSSPLVIGRDYHANNEYFDGIIDEVRVWKIALEGFAPGQPCIKIPAYPSEIVAHFSFDEGDGSIVKDKSSLKLDATLVNMSTTTAWVISGAPIGDYGMAAFGQIATGHQYNASLADGTRIFVEPIGAETKGIYVYYVGSSPTNTSGINSSEPAKAYFGVFTPLYPNVRHKVSYIIGQQECSSRLFERHDNSVQQWHELQTTIKTDTATGIMTSSRGEYIIDQIPPQNLGIQGALSFCKGSSTQLTVYTTGSVEWNNGIRDKTITVTTPGTYEATITINNCIITKKVEVVETPPPNFSLGEDIDLCYGEKTILTAPANMNSYRWSTGENTSAIEVSKSGTYWVEITNSNGCTKRDEIIVEVKPQPNIKLVQELNACYGTRLTLDASTSEATYLWSTGHSTSTVDVTAPATLSVSITVNGCTYTYPIKIKSDECPIIPNVITPNGDGKNDAFMVEGVESSTLEIEIFNRWGKSIYQSVRYDNGWSAQGVPAGLYFYNLKSSRSQNTFKGWLEVIK